MGLTCRFVVAELLIALALSPAARADFAFQSQKAPGLSQTIPAPEDRVDINTATIDQLLKVPGITRTWAARIVRYRPYRAKNELLDRGVVSGQIYDRIKDYIIAHRVAE